MTRVALAALVAVALAALGGAALAAGDAPAPPLAAPELRARLDALEREAAAEADAGEKARAAQAAELAGRLAERDRAAARALDLELEKDRLAAAQRAARGAIESLAARRKQLEAGAAEASDAARALADLLALTLRELPAEEARLDAIAPLRARLAAPDAPGALAPLPELLTLFEAVHAEGTEVRLRPAEIHTAGGRRESVRLLSVGAVAFAYETVAGERRGLALASPADATGFRWTESLPPDAAEALAAAFARLRSGGEAARSVAIPIDASGRLRVEAVRGDRGLWRALAGGGLVMIPLALVAGAAALLVALRLRVLVGDRTPEAAVERAIAACRAGRPEEAEAGLERAGGLCARVLLASLRRRGEGPAAMADAIEERLLHEQPRLERHLGGIAVLGAVAPLLGLLGTVSGIMHIFGVIKVIGSTNPALMAGGISEALVTTVTGLVIAIPVLLVHSFLAGRVEALLGDAERYAATMLSALAAPRGPEAAA